MRFSFKVLCALLLAVLAVLFALNGGWKGVLICIVLLCVVCALFIDNRLWESVVHLVGGLSLGAVCFHSGLDYFFGNVHYIPDKCSGRRSGLCQFTNEVLQAGGPYFVGLLWVCVAAGLFGFSLKAFSYMWKRRQVFR
jgi:hypothetical protein